LLLARQLALGQPATLECIALGAAPGRKADKTARR
jgi:hypothetical protein